MPCVYAGHSNQIYSTFIEWRDFSPAVLSAFVAGKMSPGIFADYLQENGVELPGRVYELLRSEGTA